MRNSTHSPLTQLVWLALAMLALASLPVLKYEALWWELPSSQLLPLAMLLGAFGVSALAVLVFVRGNGPAAALRAGLITLAVFCLCFAPLLVLRIDAPRYQVLPVFIAAIVLIPLHRLAGPLLTVTAAGLAAVLAATAGVAAYRVGKPQRTPASVSESNVRTAFYNVRVVHNRHVVPQPATRGGGLAHLAEDVLLGVGDGSFYALNVGADGAVRARELPVRAPLNREEFARAFGGSANEPALGVNAGAPGVQTWRYRMADILTQMDGEAVRIFASHHYWKQDEQCFVVRVSMLEASLESFRESRHEARWRTLYESAPCIPLVGERSLFGSNPFRGEEIGGAMALLDDQSLLLALGDQGFSGIESRLAFAQDPQAAYGKTIRIDIASGKSEVYTLGHRNPQGLYAAGDGRIWLAEHGAQGGDEVNVLTAQANYGWPLATYGVEYGSTAWPFAQRQGRHDGFVQPAYAWTPSIGVSSLIGVERGLFDVWRGDLIAGSLATRALHRLVVDGGRIVLSEPIEMNERVRDLLELNDGRLLVWTDSASLLTLEPERGSSGASSYAMLCSGCHTALDGKSHRIGPDLHGIAGRRVASAKGFDGYSPSLKALGGTWSDERLDAYLRDPQAFATGTAMQFAGVPDDAQRAALIGYLKTL